jgi:hypothetical protein
MEACCLSGFVRTAGHEPSSKLRVHLIEDLIRDRRHEQRRDRFKRFIPINAFRELQRRGKRTVCGLIRPVTEVRVILRGRASLS